MFYRNHLTLSARTNSNRTNLGTRSLALVANVKNGGQTLRARHAHHDVSREGMMWYEMFPGQPGEYSIPFIPGSISVPQVQPGALQGQVGVVAVDVRVSPDPRPADLVGRPVPCVGVGVGRVRCAARTADRSAAAAGKPAASHGK